MNDAYAYWWLLLHNVFYVIFRILKNDIFLDRTRILVTDKKITFIDDPFCTMIKQILHDFTIFDRKGFHYFIWYELQ